MTAMSSTTPLDTVTAVADDERELKRSPLRIVLDFCSHEPLGAFGMLLVLLMAFAAATETCWPTIARISVPR